MTWRCPYERCDGSGLVTDVATNTQYDCECRPRLLADKKARALSAVIPRRYRDVSFDRPPVSTDMNPTIVREVRRFADRIGERLDQGRGLWLFGDVGTGKTTLAMLVSKAALAAGRTVAIYSLPTLLSEIRRTYDDDAPGAYTRLLERLAAVDLLHIDDVGAERSNEWVLEQLYSIVNARYEDERSIVITTNLDHKQLQEQITPRTVSRLIEMCGDPLPLFGADRRMELRSA
jgi:DNA replication protein DnaC